MWTLYFQRLLLDTLADLYTNVKISTTNVSLSRPNQLFVVKEVDSSINTKYGSKIQIKHFVI